MTRREPRPGRDSRQWDAVSLRDTQLGSALEHGLRLAWRNPVPVLLLTAATGWLLHNMSKADRRRSPAEDIPVLNTGQARIYDPDVSPRHPVYDTLESRREMSARI